MTDRPPTSIVLPTVRWTDACEEVASQLGPDDELLVVCDGESDPVANRELPARTRVVVAGEPTRCSGKANAIAAGMDAASHDRLVWTDDDFSHPPEWLSSLHADYERFGPVSEVPFFVGRDPLSTLLEPIYAVGATLAIYAGNYAWGGAVMFERSDVDEATFLSELRRTMSDDGLLSDRLDLTSVRRTRLVPVGGTLRESAERHVRFTQIFLRHEPDGTTAMAGVGCLSTLAAVLFPVPTLLLSTLLLSAVYAAFGVRRWTALLAYPALLLHLPLFAYAVGRRTFVWGGRRYRWRSKFDVRIVG